MIITIVSVANVDIISGVLDNTVLSTDLTTILVGDYFFETFTMLITANASSCPIGLTLELAATLDRD